MFKDEIIHKIYSSIAAGDFLEISPDHEDDTINIKTSNKLLLSLDASTAKALLAVADTLFDEETPR